MATDVQPPPRSFRSPAEERSLGDLFKRLRDETATLFRQEVQLAKVETVEKARVYGRNGAMLGAGAVLGFAGLLFVLLGASYALAALLVRAGLSELHADWIGPLIVGVVVAIIAYALVRKGMSALKRETPVPERTIRSLQENQEWVKRKLS